MLLYLDYDGVLYPDAVYLDARNRVYLRGDGALFEHAALLEALLAPYPSLKIVLSTSWVRMKGFDRARRRLPQGLRDRVIGATWHSRFMRDDSLRDWWVSQSSRYEQIYLDVVRRRPDDWMALDDDERGWPSSDGSPTGDLRPGTRFGRVGNAGGFRAAPGQARDRQSCWTSDERWTNPDLNNAIFIRQVRLTRNPFNQQYDGHALI